MRIHKVGPVLRRLFSVFMIALLVAGVVPFSAAPVATVEATGTGLPSNEGQAAQAEAMGLSTAQPTRYAPDGSEVDKTKSPLGNDLVVTNKILQLAYNWSTNGLESQKIIKDPIKPGVGSITFDALNPYDLELANWSPIQTETVGADLDGNGQQELITIGIDNNKVELLATDYNKLTTEGKPWVSKVHTVSTNHPVSTIANTTRMIKVTAADIDHDGKDEVIVGIGNTLYLCNVDMTADTCSVSMRPFQNSVHDIEAADADKDGYTDLLIVGGRELTIYSGTDDLETPTAGVNIEGVDNATGAGMQRPGGNTTVDVGDIFGTGEQVIVVGGFFGFVTIRYNPATKTYAGDRYYNLHDSATKTPDFDAIELLDYDLKCVAFRTPAPGVGEDVVMAGFIFRYDQNSGTFKQVEIKTSVNSTGFTNNSPENSNHNISNANPNEDEVWIFKTLAGNFDGNQAGKEQILMLYYIQWHSSAYVYVAGVREVDGTKVESFATELWRNGATYGHPSISAPYVQDRGVKLEFLSDRSQFVFANPTIVAVLAAAPYYEELRDDYTNLDDAATTFGTGIETGGTTSNSLTVQAGVAVGFHQSVGVFGLELFSITVENKITASFTNTWSTSTSVSKSVSYTNKTTEDAVVVMAVPYDIYVYKATTRDPSTKQLVEDELVVEVPYEPVTTVMYVSDYNARAAQLPDAPIIGPEVLDHTVGDPRTYPTNTDNLTNVENEQVVTSGTTLDASFTGCGVGEVMSEHSITSAFTSEKQYDLSLGMEMSYSLAVAGVSVGYHGGFSYNRSVSSFSTASTTRTGSVAGLPSAYSNWKYNWALAVYNYELPAGEGKQIFPVLNYLVRYDGTPPPRVPTNFRVDSQAWQAATLKWDEVNGIGSYSVQRATVESGPFTEVESVSGGELTDDGLTTGQTYYYQLIAQQGGKYSKPAKLSLSMSSITGMTISQQPKLTYEAGDALDLTNMAVKLTLSDGTSQSFTQDVFSDKGITTNMAHGRQLTAADTGTAIAVKYDAAGLTANTGSLTVEADSPYDLGIITTFKVGSTNNATALVGGQTLQATVTLNNKTTQVKGVIVVLALYNDKGTMVEMDYDAAAIVGNNLPEYATKQFTLEVTLPASVSGYTAKVFTWDNQSFTTTSVKPMTPTVRIPQ